VGEARRCAEHLLHLINDILDISRIEAGNLSIVPSSIDIHTLMDDVRSTVAPQVRQKELELRVRCEGDLIAFADFRRARQALINLTDNAIKFTENGNVTLSACAEGASIKITVSDTGIGVSDEDRVSVFEPFFQSDSGNNRAYPGTGLGLAITRRLVELMGGVVMLESDSNPSGSTFSITLPTTEVSEPMRLTPVVSS
jgi:signal transduction histidine kinase